MNVTQRFTKAARLMTPVQRDECRQALARELAKEKNPMRKAAFQTRLRILDNIVREQPLSR